MVENRSALNQPILPLHSRSLANRLVRPAGGQFPGGCSSPLSPEGQDQRLNGWDEHCG
ncbi:MAG: hypothetical protein NC823_01690 [Candidatus Omnitrophica bacterium]|nr:hypothetical protein [Candidatus Omnitrophota bacterium]